MITKKERQEILDTLIEKYPITEQVKFNEYTIADKLEENVQLKSEYERHLTEAEFFYDQIMEKYEALKGQRYDYYRFDHDRNLSPKEIEQYYLPNDKKLIELKNILTKVEIQVKFFKTCVKALNDLYWRIKSWIDNQRS